MGETMDDFSTELNNSMRVIKEGDIVEGTVVGISDSEVTVDLQYFAEGIIRAEDYSGDPAFSIRENVSIGEAVKAAVVRMDDGHGNILLSRKKAIEILIWDELQAKMDSREYVSLKISEAVKGGLVGYYEGIRAFVPASKAALSYTEDLSGFVGQTFEAIIITVDAEKKRLVMSIRDVLKEKKDAEKAQRVSNLEVGLVTEGTVRTLTDFGAFVNIADGIDGLLHVSQIAGKGRIRLPKDVLSVGDKIKVKVTQIRDGRISLSQKALEERAAEPAPEKAEEEKIVLPKSEALTTNLGSLLKGFKFDK